MSRALGKIPRRHPHRRGPSSRRPFAHRHMPSSLQHSTTQIDSNLPTCHELLRLVGTLTRVKARPGGPAVGRLAVTSARLRSVAFDDDWAGWASTACSRTLRSAGLRKGDVLVVRELDCLGRNLADPGQHGAGLAGQPVWSRQRRRLSSRCAPGRGRPRAHRGERRVEILTADLAAINQLEQLDRQFPPSGGDIERLFGVRKVQGRRSSAECYRIIHDLLIACATRSGAGGERGERNSRRSRWRGTVRIWLGYRACGTTGRRPRAPGDRGPSDDGGSGSGAVALSSHGRVSPRAVQLSPCSRRLESQRRRQNSATRSVASAWASGLATYSGRSGSTPHR